MGIIGGVFLTVGNIDITQPMQTFVTGFDDMITKGMYYAFFSLFYIAIGIAGIKKMFLFGNMQTLSMANKIIVTAFISGSIMMIMLPIRDSVISNFKEFKIENKLIKSEELKNKINFEERKQTFLNLEKFFVMIKDAIFIIIVTLAGISLAIAAYRIKLSLGNPEVISESKKMIKITFFTLSIVLASSLIFQSIMDAFNRNGIPTIEIGTTSTTPSNTNLKANTQSDEAYKDLIDRPAVPGWIRFWRWDENFDYDFDFVPLVGESYGFKNYKEGNTEVAFYRGSSLVRYPTEDFALGIYINYGYKLTVSAGEGSMSIQVPRQDDDPRLVNLRVYSYQITNKTKKSELEENKDYFIVDTNKDKGDPLKSFPKPQRNHAVVVFSSHASLSEKELLPKKGGGGISLIDKHFGYLQNLIKGPTKDGEGTIISFSFTVDHDTQKDFKRINLLDDTKGGLVEINGEKVADKKIPIPTVNNAYIMTEDRSGIVASNRLFVPDKTGKSFGVSIREGIREDIDTLRAEGYWLEQHIKNVMK